MRGSGFKLEILGIWGPGLKDKEDGKRASGLGFVLTVGLSFRLGFTPLALRRHALRSKSMNRTAAEIADFLNSAAPYLQICLLP